MELKNKYIEYDKKLDEIFNFFNREDNESLKNNKRNQIASKFAVRNYHGKLDVFEAEDKIYKILTVWEYEKLKAIYTLALEVLDLFEIFLKYNLEYEGNNLVIISQEKLQIFNSNEEIEKYLLKKIKKINSINLNYLSNLNSDINIYFNSKLSPKKYEKLINLINFFNIRDLSYSNNYGIDKKDEIKCVDLENFNYQISYEELKDFINLNSVENFSTVIEKYPYLLKLVQE